MHANDKGLIAFKGNKFVFARQEQGSSRAAYFCKALSEVELQLIEDDPELLQSPRKLYKLLTYDLNTDNARHDLCAPNLTNCLQFQPLLNDCLSLQQTQKETSL